jgi:hypothetical protein
VAFFPINGKGLGVPGRCRNEEVGLGAVISVEAEVVGDLPAPTPERRKKLEMEIQGKCRGGVGHAKGMGHAQSKDANGTVGTSGSEGSAGSDGQGELAPPALLPGR